VRGPLLQVPADGYRRMLDINVSGTMQCARHALPGMIERKYGRIINLSTQLAQRAVGGGGFAAYAATKGATVPVYVSPFVGRLDDIGENGVIPYGGFSPVRLEGWLSKRCLSRQSVGAPRTARRSADGSSPTATALRASAANLRA